MEEFLGEFLSLSNEMLASAIVIVSASLLLYNLSQNYSNRVARTSGVALACVTIVYAGDVLLSLDPGRGAAENLHRFQWVGVAFIPAATFHLSDALLATTGLPSRGRRRRAVRFLYGVATVFMFLAAFTDWLIIPEIYQGRVSMSAAPLFWLYLLYFIIVNSIAYLNVNRARERCLTRGTQRRMAYLQAAILTPLLGIFPFSAFLEAGQEFSLGALFLITAANVVVVLMLLFLSYPLSFFGSEVPDRVVKADLLKFMLLGPGTGVVALVVIIYTAPATELIGISGEDFMPFAVVAVILLWQWSVDIVLPWLERRLIYKEEDGEHLNRIKHLSERLLTRADLLQLLEANLEATCDYLRLNGAFVASLADQRPDMIQSIGNLTVTNQILQDESLPLIDVLYSDVPYTIHTWKDYWVVGLYSGRNTYADGRPSLIGMMAVEARADEVNLSEEELVILKRFAQRASDTLDDMLLQTELYAALEGLLPQISITRGRAAQVEYRPGRNGVPLALPEALDREQVIEQVRAALRDYWGGPGMANSRLLDLVVVRNRLGENDYNPVRTLRSVLQEAIDNQRPEGERTMRSPEWTLYNILHLRFAKEKKVKETANQLFISEANLYRKQNVAIAAVADAIIKLEQEALADQKRTISQA